MTNGKFVTDWVVNTIKEQYQEDIALVVAHSTLRIDESEQVMSYFVPITDRGRQFAQDFILEGEGFDIWGIEWERLEHFADLNEYNITCLADGEVIYARTPADQERFEALKKRQADNLANPVLQRANALEAFSQAKQIYFEMLFAKGSDAKMGAAYVMDYLARAICFLQGGYFKKAQSEQVAELLSMGTVPEGFAELYMTIICEKGETEQKRLCYELICLVEKFLERPQTVKPKEHNFQDLSDWYAELTYTLLRIRHYSKTKDIVKTYMWAAMMQEELNRVCEDFGLAKIDLMSAFDSQNLAAIALRVDEVEQDIRKIIITGGGKIREYNSREAFLHEV